MGLTGVKFTTLRLNEAAIAAIVDAADAERKLAASRRKFEVDAEAYNIAQRRQEALTEAASVTINAECHATFQKMLEGEKKYRYIIFKIEDKEIIVEKKVINDDMNSAANDDYADNSKVAYDEFVQDLTNLSDNFKDCRYAVFDFKFTGSREGAGVNKMDRIVFLQIIPIDVNFKCKMIYSSLGPILKELLGPVNLMQISKQSELLYQELFSRL